MGSGLETKIFVPKQKEQNLFWSAPDLPPWGQISESTLI